MSTNKSSSPAQVAENSPATSPTTIQSTVDATPVKQVKMHPSTVIMPAFDHHDYAVLEDLSIVPARRPFMAELTLPATKRRTLIHDLGLTFQGSGSIGVPPGICVISGDTKVGKSNFVRSLVANSTGRYTRVLVCEPYDSLDEVETVPAYSSVDAAIAHAIKSAMVDDKSLWFIDSLRAPLFETTGPAGEKGIIMPFFTALTEVSNALARQGITVVATVNPMNMDRDYVASFLSKLSASTSSMIELTATPGVAGWFEGVFSIRDHSSTYHRAPMSFTYTSGQSAKPRAKVVRKAEVAFPAPAQYTPNLTDSVALNFKNGQ